MKSLFVLPISIPFSRDYRKKQFMTRPPYVSLVKNAVPVTQEFAGQIRAKLRGWAREK